MRRTYLAALGATVLLSLAPVSAFAQTVDQSHDSWWDVGPSRMLAIPPYRTQLDGSQYAGSDCGPATLGMVLDAYGIDLPTLDLRRLTHTYQGTWPGRGGTALLFLGCVVVFFGVVSFGLFVVLFLVY